MSGRRELADTAVALAAARVRPLRALAVGVSTSETCGVRDHATLLADALARADVACSLYWLQRSGESLRASRVEVAAWARDLSAELERTAPEVVLLHYSVFAFSYRGVPIFVHPVLAAARRAGVPVVTLLHEFVFPWRLGGLHGKLWAVSQRMRLIGVINASSALLVTTQRRAAWLESRRWLARRQLLAVPVFSNLPAASAAGAARERHRVGMFGYSYGADTVALVLDALGSVRERGLPARLELLGAPGADSPAAERWREQARARGLDDALSFSGRLSAQALSDRLAACEILLFADPAGPTSRKTTLAASLASGRPVVALDGPQRWDELVDREAARVVGPVAPELAGSLGELLADERLRASLGARGHEFAERIGIDQAAQLVAGLLAEVGARAA